MATARTRAVNARASKGRAGAAPPKSSTVVGRVRNSLKYAIIATLVAKDGGWFTGEIAPGEIVDYKTMARRLRLVTIWDAFSGRVLLTEEYTTGDETDDGVNRFDIVKRKGQTVIEAYDYKSFGPGPAPF